MSARDDGRCIVETNLQQIDRLMGQAQGIDYRIDGLNQQFSQLFPKDFSKALTDSHLHLLATVYGHLTTGRGLLPNDWVGGMIARLERFDGDIERALGAYYEGPRRVEENGLSQGARRYVANVLALADRYR